MSKKENNIFARVFQWLLEEWIKALLTIMAMSFLAYVGWIYRNYIKELFTSKYYLEMYGWTWILVFLLILVIPILLFWFITYILKHVNLIFVEQFTAPLWSRLCWFCLRTNDIWDKLNGMPNCVSYHIHNLRNVVAW
jgi:ABC-type multidrug transport system fused ATPase/permease subunit